MESMEYYWHWIIAHSLHYERVTVGLDKPPWCLMSLCKTAVCHAQAEDTWSIKTGWYCRLPVNSSHTRPVTKSTRHKRAHKKAIPVAIFYLHAGQVAPINSAEHGRRNYGKRVYTRQTQCCAVRFAYLGLMCVISKSPMTVKLLNATNARSFHCAKIHFCVCIILRLTVHCMHVYCVVL